MILEMGRITYLSNIWRFGKSDFWAAATTENISIGKIRGS